MDNHLQLLVEAQIMLHLKLSMLKNTQGKELMHGVVG
jgi:hypothetical protein